MRGWRWIFVLVILGGCSAEDTMSSGAEAPDCAPIGVEALRVYPDEVTRGEEVTLHFEVELSASVFRPLNLELVGGEDYNVRVLIPLLKEGASGSVNLYRAELMNPFGMGLQPSAYSVSVQQDVAFGCLEEAPLLASFLLK